MEDSEKQNDRTTERIEENKKYDSVIIKRIEEALPHPDDTLEKAIEEGVLQYEKSNFSLFLSAVAAGLILSFSAFLVILATSYTMEWQDSLLKEIIPGLLYPLGFIMCILSGTQLYTEQTSTATYVVFEGRKKIKELSRVLSLVLAGNFFGAFFASLLFYWSGQMEAYIPGVDDVYSHLVEGTWLKIFIGGVIAGWLMAQGGWLILTTHSRAAQILLIYVTTFIIGVGGFYHSIAGAAEVFVAMLLGERWTFLSSAHFLSAAILGNFFGGSIMVALLNYAHIRKANISR